MRGYGMVCYLVKRARCFLSTRKLRFLYFSIVPGTYCSTYFLIPSTRYCIWTKSNLLEPEANSYAVGFAVRWKSTFKYLRMTFCPENIGNWSSSPQDDLEYSPRSIQSCSPLLQEPSCRKSPSALFNPTGSNTITISDRIKKTFFDPIGDCNPVGSKKCRWWFPATWPLEKRETALSG